MEDKKMLDFLQNVLENMPSDWLNLTTHRLDIYDEKLAKVEFLERFEALFEANNSDSSALSELPTAFDYIRLGHPLSCVLEWVIARGNQLQADRVISFSSKTAPILAILRKNLLDRKKTRILYADQMPACFDGELLRRVYGYHFDLQQIDQNENVPAFDGSTILIAHSPSGDAFELNAVNADAGVDFSIDIHAELGSVVTVLGDQNADYVSEIQHVRRRETIAMTPTNCHAALKSMVSKNPASVDRLSTDATKARVVSSIWDVTGTNGRALVGSSGLSVQYAIMMGLVHDALENHPGKPIRFVVPPNCYGGTNDQARRVAACVDNVEIVDLPVDGANDMVRSVNIVLDELALHDAVPYIIAEIPTNPRVEVPDLEKLREALSLERKTPKGSKAIDPVFILDQTFCPNVRFLGDGDILSSVRAISYVSGSKFPSGGKCTAGYCVANEKAEGLMSKLETHIKLCDNEATDHQMEILSRQMPSMLQRIAGAYKNTREFVNHINQTLPKAKINFVSEELAEQDFTPSVFSLDLPSEGATAEEKEAHKRELNHRLINLMITRIPDESKYCVSYGQLKGCYWTIPATSTQGTTKEGDKDYIARVALSPDMDLERHKEVFDEFVSTI